MDCVRAGSGSVNLLVCPAVPRGFRSGLAAVGQGGRRALVVLVRPLGFIEPTAARRISYQESLAFEAVHEATYREHGFTLLDVPAGPVSQRVTILEAHLHLNPPP